MKSPLRIPVLLHDAVHAVCMCACVLALLAVPAESMAQLLITEVHPTPASGEPEWVECVNTGARPLRLVSWMICDSRTCASLADVTIPAGGFAVLTPDAEALAETRSVPADAVVIECRLPSLNNTVDRVELRSSDSSIVDSVTYDTRRHERGRSIERCGEWVDGTVTYRSLWSASQRRDSASCGMLNSCVLLPRDVRVMPLLVLDSSITISLHNSGLMTSAARRFVIDVGADRLRGEIPPLEPGRSSEITIDRLDLGLTDTVRTILLRVAINASDDRPENDTLETRITAAPLGPAITITEMMAEPDDHQPEYVELWNGTPRPLDVAGWTLEDASGRRCVILPPATILPSAYMAVSTDTALRRMQGVGYWTLMRPAMNINATADTVTLRTPEGLVVERVAYDDDAHVAVLTTRGRSLERRAPWSSAGGVVAWTTCVHPSGGTPGRPNSVGLPPPVIVGMRSWPDPCSAVASSAFHPCVITWEQPIEQGIGRLRIFRLDGMQVAELLNGEVIGRTGSAIWDLRDATTGAAVSVGTYVAVLECTALSTTDHHVERCLVNIGQSDLPPKKR